MDSPRSSSECSDVAFEGLASPSSACAAAASTTRTSRNPQISPVRSRTRRAAGSSRARSVVPMPDHLPRMRRRADAESIPGSVGASTIGCHETATGYGGDRPIRTNRVLRLGELVTAGKPALRDQLTIQVAEPGTDWRTVKKCLRAAGRSGHAVVAACRQLPRHTRSPSKRHSRVRCTRRHRTSDEGRPDRAERATGACGTHHRKPCVPGSLSWSRPSPKPTTLVAAMPGIGLAVLASIRLERVFMRIRAAHGQATRPPTQTRPPPLAAARAERVFPVDEAPRATINACNLTTSGDLA